MPLLARFSADEPVLPIDDQLASLPRSDRRIPRDRPLCDRRQQSAFLVLALSGLYIWWPKQFTRKALKPIVWFRRTSTGRARDFNWHNTIGFWCLIPIVIMTASGVVMSYPWANDLVYRLTGSPVPTRGGGPGGQASGGESVAGRGGRGGQPQAGGEGRGRGESAERRTRAKAAHADAVNAKAAPARNSARRSPRGPEAAVVPAELDRIWARAEAASPDVEPPVDAAARLEKARRLRLPSPTARIGMRSPDRT